MAIVTSEQSTANNEYLDRLLRQKQPEFSAVLELAVDLVEQELHPVETPRQPRTDGSAVPEKGQVLADRRRER
jgi:hypothetical protein